jgi:hypothetical protein
VVVQVLFDNLWFTVCAGIVHDEADERKVRLLHAKAFHGILDIGCLVIGVAPYKDLKKPHPRPLPNREGSSYFMMYS